MKFTRYELTEICARIDLRATNDVKLVVYFNCCPYRRCSELNLSVAHSNYYFSLWYTKKIRFE